MVGADDVHPIDRLVGANLAELRRRSGVSAEALAEALGVSTLQVSKYESGATRLTAARLYDAAALLGAPVDALFRGARDAAPAPKALVGRETRLVEIVGANGGGSDR